MAQILLSILFTTSLFCQENVATFLETLYDDNKNDYQSKNKSEFIQFCENNNIDNSKVINQEHYYFISFLHDLLTSSSASDFVAGGILNIPYLWHWLDPNPRHSITFLPNSVSLSQVSPPDKFSRYQTYADIDRTPVLYLKDLFSDKPKYYHEEFGEFYTFGWCSEREMAFNSLLSLPAFGYDCKIKQEGIHVWSEVWIEFINNDGTYSDIIARVDNTFDTISWENPLPFVDWVQDYGSGAQINWYNNQAEYQIQSVEEIIVSKNVSNRIYQLVSKALKK